MIHLFATAPITPCRRARAGELTGDTARVYDLVARHFVASVSDDAVWQSTTVRLSIDELGEKGSFTISGKQVSVRGQCAVLISLFTTVTISTSSTSLHCQLVTPGFLAIVLYKQFWDEADEGNGGDDEEEKALPPFAEGDQFGLFFAGSAKSGKVCVS